MSSLRLYYAARIFLRAFGRRGTGACATLYRLAIAVGLSDRARPRRESPRGGPKPGGKLCTRSC